MDESIFDIISTCDALDYKYYTKNSSIKNGNDCVFYIITGKYVTYDIITTSFPSEKDLPLNNYIEVIVQTSHVYDDSSVFPQGNPQL